MNIAIISGFLGLIFTALGIYIRVSKVIKAKSKEREKRNKKEMQLRRQEIHDEITIPVDKLKDNVADLKTTVHKFIDKEIEDHQDVIRVVDNSNKLKDKIFNMVKKIDNDHEQLHKHDKIIEGHTHTLDKHTNDIAFLKRTKVDKIHKKNRGNHK